VNTSESLVDDDPIEKETWNRAHGMIASLYGDMGAIWPEGLDHELEFYDYRCKPGEGHFHLHLEAPTCSPDSVDFVKLFREWGEFCTAAADNIDAARRARTALTAESAA